MQYLDPVFRLSQLNVISKHENDNTGNTDDAEI